jgi:hypothetical protein
MSSTPQFSLLPQDEARLEYGRLLWRKPHTRARLLRHWSDARHPYSSRFLRDWKQLVESLLESPSGHDDELDADLRTKGLSLRVLVREIPPVLGSFY